MKKENRVIQLGSTFQISDPRKRESWAFPAVSWSARARASASTHLLSLYSCLGPHVVVVLPEKVNHTVPTSHPSAEAVSSATQMLSTMTCLKDTDKAPNERFALPTTSSMEYGFFSSQPMVSAFVVSSSR